MALTINGTDGIETNTDTGKLKVGTGDDLTIEHDGSHSWIKNTTGNILIDTGTGSFKVWASGSEEMIDAAPNGAVKLYYDNATKLETISTGVNVTGGVRIGGNNAANELQDYENGSWTPVFVGGSATITVGGYAMQEGKYQKVGDLVYIQGVLKTSSITNNSTGTYDIGGLPFTVANDDSYGIILCSTQSGWLDAPQLLDCNANATTMRARQGMDVGDGAYTGASSNGFDETSGDKNRVYFSGCYRV